MISPELVGRLACPVCLVAEGCPECARTHATSDPDEYRRRVACACGGPDKARLVESSAGLVCACCSICYPVDRAHGFVDLVPRRELGAVTQYADHEFHERLHVSDAPPVLSARVKADMMLRMLRLEAGQPVLDLGSGAGKFALYAQSTGARATGVDVAPFFLDRAARDIDLVLGDLRRLPFRKHSYPSAYTLDVLEHLDEAGVQDVLLETRRVLTPEGALFVYTHAMESSWLAGFQRFVNRLARRLGGWGLIDHEREALRKSDHVNAIQSHEHFDALSAGAGLRVVERRYYNVVAKAVVEDLALRLVEQWRRRAASPTTAGTAGEAPVGGPRTVGGRPPGRLAYLLARGLTFFLKLDVVLFGGLRTGPFFGLLRPVASAERRQPSRAGA